MGLDPPNGAEYFQIEHKAKLLEDEYEKDTESPINPPPLPPQAPPLPTAPLHDPRPPTPPLPPVTPPLPTVPLHDLRPPIPPLPPVTPPRDELESSYLVDDLIPEPPKNGEETPPIPLVSRDMTRGMTAAKATPLDVDHVMVPTVELPPPPATVLPTDNHEDKSLWMDPPSQGM